MERDISVLHIANSYFFVDRLLKGKLDGLRDAGIRVFAAAPKPNTGAAPDWFIHLDIPRSVSPTRDAAAFFRTVSILGKNRFDVCHTHSSKAGFIGRAAARFSGVPCVHSVHGLPFSDGRSTVQNTVYKKLEGYASRRCECILTQNHEELETLARTFKLPRSMLFYEGNGLDTAKTASYAACRDTERSRLCIPKNAVVFGMFARFEPVKRHLLFLRAFEALARERRDVWALFAGGDLGLGGKYALHVQEALRNSPAKDRIIAAGFLSEPLFAMAACDVLVLTSEKEGLPRCVMEAMTLGIPVAATDVTGTRELVRHGATGYLSPFNDVRALLNNMGILADNQSLRRAMGDSARRFAHCELNEADVIKRIIDAYRVVIESNRRST